MQQQASEAEAEVEQLSRHLQACRDSLTWSPTGAAFAALERKIDSLEAAAAAQQAAAAAAAQQQQLAMAGVQPAMRHAAAPGGGAVGAAGSGGVLGLMADIGLLPAAKQQQQHDRRRRVDVDSVVQHYEGLLAAKTAEVEGFRAQVDALLTAAKQLMEQRADGGGGQLMDQLG